MKILQWLTFALACGGISALARADIAQAPPPFAFDGGTAVFIDFERVNYRIVYDLDKEESWVQSEIDFTAPHAGFPIFDLVPEPADVELDGTQVATELTSDPQRATEFRVVNRKVLVGRHRMVIRHCLQNGVSFRREGVASAFWMSDLSDRQYLEQYLPANFEFDQVPMQFQVEILGANARRHVVYTNGDIVKGDGIRFTIQFPNFFTTSSIFFHLVPEGVFPVHKFLYRSVDGRSIRVQIYSKGDIGAYTELTVSTLNELERDYGPFPHPQLTIYGTQAGMEYAGATASSLSALGHEIFHSYNARGVMPAQGNAGWMDEAITSWRDQRYRLRDVPGGRTRMAGHSKWARMTDDSAYTKGRDFLGWVAGQMDKKGQSLKTFLALYFKKYFYKTVTTEMFQQELQTYSGLDLRSDFATYIYGRTPELRRTRETRQESQAENRYHPRLTRQQLHRMLWQ